MQTDWTVTERDGVCLVRAVVENPAPVARRVAVSNRLDGPVMPPRREGVPERGWTEDGFEGTVPAEGRLALGYACPAPAARPPVEVDATGRADPDADADNPDADDPTDATPEAVVRRLGTHAPPADAVPSPSPTPDDAAVASTTDAARPDDAGDPTDDGRDPSASRVEPTHGDSSAGPRSPDVARPDDAASPDALPDEAAAWLAAVEARVDRADRLDGASVAAATAVVREAGGLEAVAALPDRLDADAAALRAVARRADRLADRAESAEIPVDALRRLA